MRCGRGWPARPALRTCSRRRAPVPAVRGADRPGGRSGRRRRGLGRLGHERHLRHDRTPRLCPDADRRRRGDPRGDRRRRVDPPRAAAVAPPRHRRGRDRTHRGSLAPAPRDGVADEIGQLTGVLDRMLAALEASRAIERRFLADASHELRTPVTALLGNVEFAARHGADAEVLAELRARRHAARAAGRRPARARARGRPRPQELPVDLTRLVREWRRVTWATRGSRRRARAGIRARGRGCDRRVLGNLIENGLVHGPAGGRVTCQLPTRRRLAIITVSDEGPARGRAKRARVRAILARAGGLRAPGLGPRAVDRLGDRRAPRRTDLGAGGGVHGGAVDRAPRSRRRDREASFLVPRGCWNKSVAVR